MGSEESTLTESMTKNKPMVLDANCVFDGRIANLCEVGIIDAKLIVPQFVLDEVQALASHSDRIIQKRGKRGLHTLNRINKIPRIELKVHKADQPALQDVASLEERSIVFTKLIGGRLVTTDSKTVELAQQQLAEVIDMNAVARASAEIPLGGDVTSVKVVQAGKQLGQGVGYLPGGVMVVIEGARQKIGDTVDFTVTETFETPGGPVVFGKLKPEKSN